MCFAHSSSPDVDHFLNGKGCGQRNKHNNALVDTDRPTPHNKPTEERNGETKRFIELFQISTLPELTRQSQDSLLANLSFEKKKNV